MQTVTRETPYPSRRAFCCGLGAALALPMVDRSVLAQAPAAQEAAGPPMLPLRSPGLEHLGLTVPDPEAAAKFYGRIFGPQLFREREAPPRYYVMAGTAYLAFGGSATVTPLVDHFCALVHDYRGREMGPRLQGMGIQLAGAGMITDHDGLRLQLLGVPGGLAGTIVPGGRMSLEPPVVHAVGLDHVTLRVSDLERSAIFYRTFFGNERPRTKDKPPRVWFQIGNTRLGLEAAPTGSKPAVDHFCLTVAGFERRAVETAFKHLNVELSPSDDEKLLRFRDPHGIVVELKSA
jgi:catechol 2,3-dioxygenase-like lactoylglutathione lyase family enzyme